MIVKFKLRTGAYFFLGKVALKRNEEQDIDLDSLTYEEQKLLLNYYNEGFGFFYTVPKLNEVLVLPDVCDGGIEPVEKTNTPVAVLVSQDGARITGMAEANSIVTAKDVLGSVLSNSVTTVTGDFTIPLNPPKTNGELLYVSAILEPKLESDTVEVRAPIVTITWISDAVNHYTFLSSQEGVETSPKFIASNSTLYSNITSSDTGGKEIFYKVEFKLNNEVIKEETSSFMAYDMSSVGLEISDAILPEDNEVISEVNVTISDNIKDYVEDLGTLPVYPGPYFTIPESPTLEIPSHETYELELKGYSESGRKTFPLSNIVTVTSNPPVGLEFTTVHDYNKIDLLINQDDVENAMLTVVVDNVNTFNFQYNARIIEKWITETDKFLTYLVDTQANRVYTPLIGVEYAVVLQPLNLKSYVTFAKIFVKSDAEESTSVLGFVQNEAQAMPISFLEDAGETLIFSASNQEESFRTQLATFKSFHTLTPVASPSISPSGDIISGVPNTFSFYTYDPDTSQPLELTDLYVYVEDLNAKVVKVEIISEFNANITFELEDENIPVTGVIGFVINNKFTASITSTIQSEASTLLTINYQTYTPNLKTVNGSATPNTTVKVVGTEESALVDNAGNFVLIFNDYLHYGMYKNIYIEKDGVRSKIAKVEGGYRTDLPQIQNVTTTDLGNGFIQVEGDVLGDAKAITVNNWSTQIFAENGQFKIVVPDEESVTLYPSDDFYNTGPEEVVNIRSAVYPAKFSVTSDVISYTPSIYQSIIVSSIKDEPYTVTLEDTKLDFSDDTNEVSFDMNGQSKFKNCKLLDKGVYKVKVTDLSDNSVQYGPRKISVDFAELADIYVSDAEGTKITTVSAQAETIYVTLENQSLTLPMMYSVTTSQSSGYSYVPKSILLQVGEKKTIQVKKDKNVTGEVRVETTLGVYYSGLAYKSFTVALS